MQIVERQISELIEAEYNPRQLTEKQHQDLTDSMKRFGVVDPIIVNKHPDRENIVVGGHMRLRCWQALGNDTIPTVEVELDRDKERELNIRLNRNSGEWDWDALANEFDVDDLTDWGFSKSDLSEADWQAEVQKLAKAEKYEPEPPQKTWVLICCPTSDFGKIAEHVEKIGAVDGVETETSVTD